MFGDDTWCDRRWIAAFLAAVYVGATLVYGVVTVEPAIAAAAPMSAADSCACCSGGGCSDTCCCGGDEVPPDDGLVMSGSCDLSAPASPVELRRWALPEHVPHRLAVPQEQAAECVHSLSIIRRLNSIDLPPPAKIPIAV